MSADAWRKCPRCRKKELEARQELENWIAVAYGTVPAEEYLEATKRLAQFKMPEDAFELEAEDSTYRENEESYFQGGHLVFSYSGWCTQNDCGYKLVWRTSVPVPEP